MGRKKMNDEKKKGYTLSIRLTNEQRERLEKAAADDGLSVATFARRLVYKNI